MSLCVLQSYLNRLEYVKNALIIETNRGTFYVDRTEYNHFHCLGKHVNFYFYVIPFLFRKIHKIIFMDFVKLKETVVYENYKK